jgi:hypothetical protein
MMISCWSKHFGVLLSVFSELHFKLMFYYTDVRLLAHYIQWIKMHGETVKCYRQFGEGTLQRDGHDQEWNKLQRQKILISMYPIYNHNWRNISTIYRYITRLASNEIFSPSNKIHGEAGRAKDLSAPLYKALQHKYFYCINKGNAFYFYKSATRFEPAAPPSALWNLQNEANCVITISVLRMPFSTSELYYNLINCINSNLNAA